MIFLTTTLLTFLSTIYTFQLLLKQSLNFSKRVGCQKNLVEKLTNMKRQLAPTDDTYTEEFLKQRFNTYKISYQLESEMIHKGIPIRHQNPPEDMTENMVKFIIRNYDNDPHCVWCKCIDKKHGLVGDLYSPKYDKTLPIEVKAFTSVGPTQFGPNKKFSILYFLDMRNFLEDKFILWKVNLNDESPEFQNIRINKNETIKEQQLNGRRPRIGWDKIYSQIPDHCEMIYDGPFDSIIHY